MKVGLGIPFGSDDNSRRSAADHVHKILLKLYPWANARWFEAWNPDRSFNRARARNTAVDELTRGSCDVIVLCDADSYPQAQPLKEAIWNAWASETVHFPFDKVNVLKQDGTINYSYGRSAGGCWVFRPEVWYALGGMDERLGWSGDDRTFLVQINTLSPERSAVYHSGTLTSLWHARGAETKLQPGTTAVIEEYLALEGQASELREYMRSRQQR